MPTVIWKDLIKVIVGEIRRADELTLGREIEAIDLTDGDFLRIAREIDGYLMCAACRALYICRDGNWVRVTGGQPVTIALGEDDTFVLSYPPTINEIAALPASLDAEWSSAVAEDNHYIQDTFLRSLSIQTTMPKPSAPSSDSVPSSEPPNPV